MKKKICPGMCLKGLRRLCIGEKCVAFEKRFQITGIIGGDPIPGFPSYDPNAKIIGEDKPYCKVIEDYLE